MERELLLSGILLSVLGLIAGQHLPDISCPQYFEYLGYNQQYIGHIALRLEPQFINELVVEFSQFGAYQWSNVGSLSLMDDQDETTAHLREGRSINYRVDFPIPGQPPKLTKIQLNGLVLCSAAPYRPPNTGIALMHTLRSTTVPLSVLGTRRIAPKLGSWRATTQTQQANSGGARQPDLFEETFSEPELREQTNSNSRDNSQPAPIDQSLSSVCGRERAVTTPLIFQGQQLQRGQLPWLVGLFERERNSALTFFCGGTLISSWTVLSAAHCFRVAGRDLPASRAVVSLGRNSIDVVTEGELREVSQLLYHDAYEPFSANADMVLVRLSKQIIFNDYIVPICLWNDNYALQLPSGYKTYVAGWGPDENGNANTHFAKITHTNIVTEADCLRESVRSLVQPNTLCAKRAGAGPCASDGGGAMMLRESNIWILRGVISLGLQKNNTCDLDRPSLYTDVAKHIAWVRQSMWE